MAQGPGGYVGGVGVMPYYGGFGGGGYGGWGFNDWGAGSTPAGSYLTGMANAIRAEGEYNLNTSAAAINLEEAAETRHRKSQAVDQHLLRDAADQRVVHPSQAAAGSRGDWARPSTQSARAGTEAFARSGKRQIIWPSALQGE